MIASVNGKYRSQDSYLTPHKWVRDLNIKVTTIKNFDSSIKSWVSHETQHSILSLKHSQIFNLTFRHGSI